MGRTGAEGFAEAVTDGDVSLSAALEWHLTANHYPPLPTALIPVAEKAIELAKEAVLAEDLNDDYEKANKLYETEIELPNTIAFKNRRSVTVSEAVSTLHLGSFI